MNKAGTLEENLALLEQLLESMEGQELSLEASFEIYTKGLQLLGECASQIDKVEKQVQMLTREGGLMPLDGEEA